MRPAFESRVRQLEWVALSAFIFLPCWAQAAILWRGDFSTGDLSQWQTQAVNPDRLQIVPAGPNPTGQPHALRVTVKQGDNPIHASGNRNEVLNPVKSHEGQSLYYRWQVQFDPSFPNANSWQLFTQWHQEADCCGSPPIQFYVKGEEILLSLGTTENTLWTTPLVRGQWLDFVIHINFSDDPKVGFLELWYNGQRVMDKTYGPTHAIDYLKLGLYRNANIAPVGIVYHTGMVEGETYADVVPNAPPSGPATAARAEALTPSSGAPATGGCSSAPGAAPAAGLLFALWALQHRFAHRHSRAHSP